MVCCIDLYLTNHSTDNGKASRVGESIAVITDIIRRQFWPASACVKITRFSVFVSGGHDSLLLHVAKVCVFSVVFADPDKSPLAKTFQQDALHGT